MNKTVDNSLVIILYFNQTCMVVISYLFMKTVTEINTRLPFLQKLLLVFKHS